MANKQSSVSGPHTARRAAGVTLKARRAVEEAAGVFRIIDEERETVRSELLYFLRSFSHIPHTVVREAERTLDEWVMRREDRWWHIACNQIELVPHWLRYVHGVGIFRLNVPGARV